MRQRNYKMDNFRFLLIFLVLMGHFMELFKGNFTSDCYKLIYSFHMPAFLFLTGYFARFDRRKIVLNLIYPYFLFQILYRIFDALIYKGKDTFTLEFTTPYWLLWYLLVTIFCYLLLPVFDSKHKDSRVAFVCASLFLALFAGFDHSIGYYGSLSRFFSFLPFFLVGYYAAQLEKKKNYPIWLTVVLGLFILVASYYVIHTPEITRNVLYGSYSYEKAKYNILLKLFLTLLGFAWIAFLLLIMPNRKFPFLTILGQHTLSVFLLHGFLVRLAKKHKWFCYSEAENLLLAVILSITIIVLFGNPWSAKWFERLFTGAWMNAFLRNKRT